MIQLMLHQVHIFTCLYPTGLTSKKLKDILKVNSQTESESENIIAPGSGNQVLPTTWIGKFLAGENLSNAGG